MNNEDSFSHSHPEPTVEDFAAADRALILMDDVPEPHTSAYKSLRRQIATIHAEIGADRFELYFGLREPKDELERMEVLFQQQKMTQEEFTTWKKEYATRPVDTRMLELFCDWYEDQLSNYAKMIETASEVATDEYEPPTVTNRDTVIDGYHTQMMTRSRLFSEELHTVHHFLTELRIGKGEVVRCGEFTGDNAHWIMSLVCRQVSDAWNSCQQIAKRSHTDPQYISSTSATNLFYKTWVEPSRLPKPNDLAALLRLEQVMAEKALKNSAKSEGVNSSLVASASASVGDISINNVTVINQELLDRLNAQQRRSSGDTNKADSSQPEHVSSTKDDSCEIDDIGGPAPDEFHPGDAIWDGKHIKLGRDTQLSRLFWHLAKPLGKKRHVEEIQMALDGYLTDKSINDEQEVERWMNQLRVVITKLRVRLREAGLDQGVAIIREGSGLNLTYAMINTARLRS